MIARNDRISDFAARHAFPDGFDHPRGFVSKDGREETFWVLPGERVRVRVAQRRVGYFHAHFALLRRGDDDFGEFERGVRSDCYCGGAGNLFNRRGRRRGYHDGAFDSRERERERFSPRRCAYQRATINMRLEKWRFLDDIIFQFPIFSFLSSSRAALLFGEKETVLVKENRAATKRARERGRQRQRREEEEETFLRFSLLSLVLLPSHFYPFSFLSLFESTNSCSALR